MSGKKKINTAIKYIGNIVMILAIIMVVRRLCSYEVDYSIIFCRKNIFFFIGIITIYSITVIVGGVPWMNIVRVLSNCSIHYSEVVLIYTKSNMFKYIPGNIFQYAGRNELAINKNLKHSEVALATLLDVIWYVFTALVISVILAGSELNTWLKKQGGMSWIWLAVAGAVGVVCVIIFLGIYKKKKQVIKEIAGRLFSLQFFGVLAFNFMFYMILGVVGAGQYVAVFSVLNGSIYSLHEIVTVTGVMLVAVVVGFLTPGSPGGIGIREAVSLFLLNGIIDESVILSGIVIMRVLSIIGDIVPCLVMWLLSKVKRI